MVRVFEPARGARHGVRPAADAPRVIEPAGLRADGMLLVGATGRDAGKTEFACAVLRRWTAARELVAIKVTAIHDDDRPCPRGAEGCGLCSELHAPFEIVEERGAEPGKDTARLLQSGAQRVLWLRAHDAALPDAAAALLERIGPRTLCLCESNSLRRVVEPGLFLMLHRRGSTVAKRSAAAVADLADAEVLSEGRAPSVACEGVQVVAGPRWALRLPATAIVLAGGSSTRMGRDKSLLPCEGHTLIEQVIQRIEPFFEEILVSTGDADRYPFLRQRCVPDRVPGRGPMMGIASALACSSHELNLVVPCDAPDVALSLALRLLRAARGADGAVPLSAAGWPEPLFAVYHRRTRSRMEQALAAGEHRIARIFADLDLRYTPLPSDVQLGNLNTPEDYRNWLERR